jgi:hypothetical protein
MFENIAAKGIKQNGHPDIETIKLYQPELLYAFALLMKKMGKNCDWLINGTVPDIIISGYRDTLADVDVKTDVHWFAIALDIIISFLDAKIPSNQERILNEQILWISTAIGSKLFTRAGIYPQQNTIHLDIADKVWMEQYHGTPFWVKWDGNYTGFYSLNEAEKYSRQLIYRDQI